MSDEKGQELPPQSGSGVDWDRLLRDLDKGVPYSELSKRYGVSKGAISKRAKKEGKAPGPRPGQRKSEPQLRREARALAAQQAREAARLVAEPASLPYVAGELETVRETAVNGNGQQLPVVSEQRETGVMDEARRKAQEATPRAVDTAIKHLDNPKGEVAIKAAHFLFDVARTATGGGSKRLGDMTAEELKALAVELRGRERVIEGEVIAVEPGK